MSRSRGAAIAVAGAALAVAAGPRGPLGGFWAPAPGIPVVHGALLTGFIGENLVECVSFGLGLAVLAVGRPWFAARIPGTGAATAGRLAAVWLLASWFPHAALHLHIGMGSPGALLAVEWVFHGGAIVAVGVLLWALSGVLARETVGPGG